MAEFIFDSPLKIYSRMITQITRKSKFSQSESQSDSEITKYSKMIWEFNQNDKKFRKFRRYFNYRLILEHVDFKLGKKYLSKINSISPSFILENRRIIKNDKIGNPRVYYYPIAGSMSPTTLRYIAVMLEIKELFKLKGPVSVAEIGVGYGGQFAILNSFLEIENYSAFDLPQVLDLAERYVGLVSNTDKFVKKDISNIQPEKFDLIVSNYAYSELPIHIQREYLEKLISQSKMGYMIMNSGKSDFTGRSKGKISLEELQTSIGNSEVLEEFPLTGPDNYLLVWGRA